MWRGEALSLAIFILSRPLRSAWRCLGEWLGCGGGLPGAVRTRGGGGAPPTAYEPLGRGASIPRLEKYKEKEAAYHSMYDPLPHVVRLEIGLAAVAPSGRTHPGRTVSQGL